LPNSAWGSLTRSEVASTNRAKAAGNKAGKQFVAQPRTVAQKAARHR
jgi:hypothetical protein